MHPKCENNSFGQKCDEPSHGQFGIEDLWFCFEHGMAYLERTRVMSLVAMVDRCPDGPHCGCDYHRDDEEDDE
jgi:hypothetical protein